MSKLPLVSVILTAYNDEEHVEESINSILQQDYTNIELLVADDGSKDSTKLIIDRIADDRILRFHNKENIGLLNTWNKLIRVASGEYLIFQDADDVSHKQRISKLLFFLESNLDYAICGSNYVRFNRPWGLYTVSNFPTTYNEIIKGIETFKIPFFGKVMYRKEVFERYGFFREYFKGFGWEDFDLILRVSESEKIANISDVVYDYRYRRDSSSKITLDSPKERLFIDKIGFFLRNQRCTYGIDSIEANEISIINTFVNSLTDAFSKNQLLEKKYDRIFSSMIYNKDFLGAGSFFIQNFKFVPMSHNFKSLKKIILSFGKTAIKYLRFRLSKKLRYSIDEF